MSSIPAVSVLIWLAVTVAAYTFDSNLGQYKCPWLIVQMHGGIWQPLLSAMSLMPRKRSFCGAKVICGVALPGRTHRWAACWQAGWPGKQQIHNHG